jgi:hypothetical protein
MSGGALVSLNDMYHMHGQPDPTIQAKVTVPAKGESGGNREVGGGRSKRHDIVRDVMRQHGLSLPAASKYVKEHGLYCK